MQLLLAFALGVGLGAFYDLYRVWFRGARSRPMRGLGDLLWWGAALFLAAGALYRIDALALRLPPLLLALLGVAVQQACISPWAFPLLQRCCRFIGRFWRGLRRLWQRAVAVLLLPLVWPVELAFRLLLLLARLLGALFGRIEGLLRRLLARPLGCCRRLAGLFWPKIKRIFAPKPEAAAESAPEAPGEPPEA